MSREFGGFLKPGALAPGLGESSHPAVPGQQRPTLPTYTDQHIDSSILNHKSMKLLVDRVTESIETNAVSICYTPLYSPLNQFLPFLFQHHTPFGHTSTRQIVCVHGTNSDAIYGAIHSCSALKSILGDKVGYITDVDTKFSPHTTLFHTTYQQFVLRLLQERSLSSVGLVVLCDLHSRAHDCDVDVVLATLLSLQATTYTANYTATDSARDSATDVATHPPSSYSSAEPVTCPRVVILAHTPVDVKDLHNYFAPPLAALALLPSRSQPLSSVSPRQEAQGTDIEHQQQHQHRMVAAAVPTVACISLFPPTSLVPSLSSSSFSSSTSSPSSLSSSSSASSTIAPSSPLFYSVPYSHGTRAILHTVPVSMAMDTTAPGPVSSHGLGGRHSHNHAYVPIERQEAGSRSSSLFTSASSPTHSLLSTSATGSPRLLSSTVELPLVGLTRHGHDLSAGVAAVLAAYGAVVRDEVMCFSSRNGKAGGDEDEDSQEEGEHGEATREKLWRQGRESTESTTTGSPRVAVSSSTSASAGVAWGGEFWHQMRSTEAPLPRKGGGGRGRGEATTMFETEATKDETQQEEKEEKEDVDEEMLTDDELARLRASHAAMVNGNGGDLNIPVDADLSVGVGAGVGMTSSPLLFKPLWRTLPPTVQHTLRTPTRTLATSLSSASSSLSTSTSSTASRIRHLQLSLIHSAHPGAPYVLAHVPSLQYAQIIKAKLINNAVSHAVDNSEGSAVGSDSILNIARKLPLVHVLHPRMSQFEVQSLLLSLHTHMLARSHMFLACNTANNTTYNTHDRHSSRYTHHAGTTASTAMSADATGLAGAGAIGVGVGVASNGVGMPSGQTPLLVLCVGDVVHYASLFGHKSALFDAEIAEHHMHPHPHVHSHVNGGIHNTSTNTHINMRANPAAGHPSSLDHSRCWRYLLSPDITIDTGLQYLAFHSPLSGQHTVKCMPISQNQAALRASMGTVVLRLYDTATLACLPRQYNAVTRMNLTQFVLRTYALGFPRPKHMFFRDHIPDEEILWARGILVKSGMLAHPTTTQPGILKFPKVRIPICDVDSPSPLTPVLTGWQPLSLTQRGMVAAMMPVDVEQTTLLLQALTEGCPSSALDTVAIAATGPLLSLINTDDTVFAPDERATLLATLSGRDKPARALYVIERYDKGVFGSVGVCCGGVAAEITSLIRDVWYENETDSGNGGRVWKDERNGNGNFMESRRVDSARGRDGHWHDRGARRREQDDVGVLSWRSPGSAVSPGSPPALSTPPHYRHRHGSGHGGYREGEWAREEIGEGEESSVEEEDADIDDLRVGEGVLGAQGALLLLTLPVDGLRVTIARSPLDHLLEIDKCASGRTREQAQRTMVLEGDHLTGVRVLQSVRKRVVDIGRGVYATTSKGGIGVGKRGGNEYSDSDVDLDEEEEEEMDRMSDRDGCRRGSKSRSTHRLPFVSQPISMVLLSPAPFDHMCLTAALTATSVPPLTRWARKHAIHLPRALAALLRRIQVQTALSVLVRPDEKGHAWESAGPQSRIEADLEVRKRGKKGEEKQQRVKLLGRYVDGIETDAKADMDAGGTGGVAKDTNGQRGNGGKVDVSAGVQRAVENGTAPASSSTAPSVPSGTVPAGAVSTAVAELAHQLTTVLLGDSDVPVGRVHVQNMALSSVAEDRDRSLSVEVGKARAQLSGDDDVGGVGTGGWGARGARGERDQTRDNIHTMSSSIGGGRARGRKRGENVESAFLPPLDHYAFEKKLVDVTDSSVVHYSASSLPLDSDICGPSVLSHRLLRCLLTAYWPYTLRTGAEITPATERLGSALGDVYEGYTGVLGQESAVAGHNISGGNIGHVGGARTNVAEAGGGVVLGRTGGSGRDGGGVVGLSAGGVHGLSMDDFITPAPRRGGRVAWGDAEALNEGGVSAIIKDIVGDGHGNGAGRGRGRVSMSSGGGGMLPDYGEADAEGDEDTVGLQRDVSNDEYARQTAAVEQRMRGQYGADEVNERHQREAISGVNGMLTVTERGVRGLLVRNTGASESVGMTYIPLLLLSYHRESGRVGADAYASLGMPRAHVLYRVVATGSLYALRQRVVAVLAMLYRAGGVKEIGSAGEGKGVGRLSSKDKVWADEDTTSRDMAVALRQGHVATNIANTSASVTDLSTSDDNLNTPRGGGDISRYGGDTVTYVPVSKRRTAVRGGGGGLSIGTGSRAGASAGSGASIGTGTGTGPRYGSVGGNTSDDDVDDDKSTSGGVHVRPVAGGAGIAVSTGPLHHSTARTAGIGVGIGSGIGSGVGGRKGQRGEVSTMVLFTSLSPTPSPGTPVQASTTTAPPPPLSILLSQSSALAPHCTANTAARLVLCTAYWSLCSSDEDHSLTTVRPLPTPTPSLGTAAVSTPTLSQPSGQAPNANAVDGQTPSAGEAGGVMTVPGVLNRVMGAAGSSVLFHKDHYRCVTITDTVSRIPPALYADVARMHPLGQWVEDFVSGLHTDTARKGTFDVDNPANKTLTTSITTTPGSDVGSVSRLMGQMKGDVVDGKIYRELF